MKLSHHGKIRISQRIGIDKREQKQFFKSALLHGKSPRDFPEDSEIGNFLLKKEENGNCKAKLYKGYVFIHSKNSKRLYTVYKLPSKFSEEKEMRKARIKENVEHQEIGGKEIIIERELTIDDVLNMDFNKMPIAMYNFIIRRNDLIEEKNGKRKVYYGHVGILGYFVADDELEGDII